MKREQRVAVWGLRMPDGRLLRRQVLVFRAGKLQRYYPLTEEEAFTKWYGGEIAYESVCQSAPDSPTPIQSLL